MKVKRKVNPDKAALIQMRRAANPEREKRRQAELHRMSTTVPVYRKKTIKLED